MPKMHYFSTNFQKSSSAGGSPPPASLNLWLWWSEVTWCCQMKSNFKTISYDVISDVMAIMSPKSVTKIFHFGPLLQSKFLATPVLNGGRNTAGINLI